LAFSRHGNPHRTPSDLNQVVQKTVELVGHRVALSHLRLDLALEPGIPLVPCDPAQIEQILLNLVINAAEALKARGRIAIRTHHDAAADQIVLEVEDDGPGIPRTVLRRIFEPFFTTKTEGKGVGLGLSVAYGIAEAHGGRLSVESEEGKRTVFTLRLPLHPREPVPEVPS
jgi:signal transduction histidine kinase